MKSTLSFSVLFVIILTWLAFGITTVHAQEKDVNERIEEVASRADATAEALVEVQNDVAALKKLKITGYVQSQWEYTDNDYATIGANFIASNVHNRFLVRRGRVKFQYKANDWSEFVIQPDLTNSGLTLKDAYVRVKESHLKTFSITAGQFNRPWYEVEFSSSSRETPERARVTTTLFTGEREVGAMLTIAPPFVADWDMKLDVAAFNGNFTGTPSNDVDNGKDVMSRFAFSPFATEDASLDVSATFYYGGVRCSNDTVFHGDGYAAATTPWTSTGQSDAKDTLVTSEVRPGTFNTIQMGDKQFIGGEAQFFLSALPFGGTILKGGYVTGQLPTSAGVSPMTIKQIAGFYAYFIQNLGTATQLVAKYDSYDPNTERSGDQINRAADLTISTLAIGVNHYLDGNVRLTAYYEMPTQETSKNVNWVFNNNNPRQATPTSANSPGNPLTSDLRDNKFTLRLQYKF